MTSIGLKNIFVQPLSWPVLQDKRVDVAVLRLDTLHPIISGNKWFKLRFYLEEAKQLGKKTIVTWGGAWSNHIPATAAACRMQELHSIGLIRGEKGDYLSTNLQYAREAGMELIFLSREEYDQKMIPGGLPGDPALYFINEGGYGAAGAAGAATMMDHCNKEEYSHLCCAVGTGTMAAGLLKAALSTQMVVGVCALKNQTTAEEKIRAIAGDVGAALYISHDHHFGGYARYKPELITFMNELFSSAAIPTDFVYTGKLFFAIHDLVTKNFFPQGSRLLLIHSGGLTGNQSLNRTLIF